MDPLRKMMRKFSQGRRSSVEPTRFQMDESCVSVGTTEKKYKSGIPKLSVPASMKKRRSSSCDRNQPRCSTVKNYDRSNIAAGLLFTPQNAVTPKVSLSARAAVDCISQLSCKSYTGRKDHRSVSDKGVQQRNARHVSCYLNETGLVGDLMAGGQGKAPSGAIQTSDLRNINKNAFITLFNLLYKQLGAKSEVNSSCFQEKIPAIAKKLSYPGIINKSHLLTPSSPHSWPYVIAFLSWMVDLVEVYHYYESMANDQSNIAMVFMRFHLKAYNAYNNQEIPDQPTEESVEAFQRELWNMKEVEPEVMKELRDARDKIKDQYEAELAKERALKEETLAKEKHYQDMVQSIEEGVKMLKNLDFKIEQMKQEKLQNDELKEHLAKKLEQLRNNKKALAVHCSQQKMTKAEWDKLVSETKELEENNKIISMNIDSLNKTIEKTDAQISAKRNKLSKLWMNFMTATMPIQPDTELVKNLLDEIKTFHPLEADALHRFKTIEELLQNAHTEIKTKVFKDQSQAKMWQDQMQESILKAKEIRKKVENLCKICDEKKSELRCQQDHFDLEVEELNSKVNAVKMEIKRLEEMPYNNNEEELEKVKKEAARKQKEFEEYRKEGLEYIKAMTEKAESYHTNASKKIHSFIEEAEEIWTEIKELNSLYSV